MNQLPIIKTNEMVVQEIENELLIYDLQTNQAYCLNETSAIIYQVTFSPVACTCVCV